MLCTSARYAISEIDWTVFPSPCKVETSAAGSLEDVIDAYHLICKDTIDTLLVKICKPVESFELILLEGTCEQLRLLDLNITFSACWILEAELVIIDCANKCSNQYQHRSMNFRTNQRTIKTSRSLGRRSGDTTFSCSSIKSRSSSLGSVDSSLRTPTGMQSNIGLIIYITSRERLSRLYRKDEYTPISKSSSFSSEPTGASPAAMAAASAAL